MTKIITHSSEETQQVAADLAKEFSGGVIALTGELGAGKTTFVQGFAKGLGIKDKIISPTFILIRQHPIPKTKKMLYHIDLYRLEGTQDIKDLGIQEIMENPNNIVVLIEWAEKIEKLLPKNTLKISLNTKAENIREIIIS